MALTLATGATILLGCGGGGGDGGVVPPPGGPQACGSAAGSTTPVFCGSVKDAALGTPVANVPVTLKNAAGATVGTATSTDSNGFFRFAAVPATTVGVSVQTPAAYYPNSAKYGADYWDLLRGAITTGAVLAGDKDLGSILLTPTSSPPPPPATKP
jgi:hypothetical protein